MNYKLAKVIGVQEPEDGFTVEEKEIEKLLVSNTVQSLYAKIPTNRLRFIVAAHFELGYTQQDIASILGITQPALADEISLIQRILLGKKYKSRRKEGVIKVEDMFQVMLILAKE